MASYGEPPEGWDIFLRNMYSYALSMYGPRNARIEKVREARWNLKQPEIPNAFKTTTKPFNPPMVRDLLRRARSIMSASYPTPKVPPLDPADIKSQENAIKRASWLSAAYRVMGRENLIFPKVVDAMLATGMGVWKLLVKSERWSLLPDEDEPPDQYLGRVAKLRKTKFPFSWDFVPTGTFYPLAWDEDGLSEVIEITKRVSHPLMGHYGLKYLQNGQFDFEDYGQVMANTSFESYAAPFTVTFVEYWNRDRYAIMVENLVVEEHAHDLDRPPYFYAHFGLTSDPIPEFETEGLADGLIELQDHIASFVTVHQNWLFLNGFPYARLRPISEDAIQEYDVDQTIIAISGETVKAPPGYIWEWVPPPPASAGFDNLRLMLKDMADQVSLAPILHGQASGISGPVASTLVAIAKSIFGPGVDALSMSFDDMASFMQSIIENVLHDDVPVWTGDKWLSLGPSDIDQYYEVQHHLKPVIPMEQIQKSIYIGQQQQAGAVSMRYYRDEGIGLADPVAMDREVTVENLRKQPEYRQALMARVLQVIAPQQAAQASTGTPPQPMTGPGGPGIPQLPGIQQPMQPGMQNPAEGTLAGHNAAPPPGRVPQPRRMPAPGPNETPGPGV